MSGLLTCPDCSAPLHGGALQTRGTASCPSCKRAFEINENGFISFVSSEKDYKLSEKYINTQRTACKNRYAFLKNTVIGPAGAGTILDAGCGLGMEVRCMLRDGFDAYGIDCSPYLNHWGTEDHPRDRFFRCDAAKLPFGDNSFDLTISLGVIEHVGAAEGGVVLENDFLEKRQAYANSLLRVTRPGGFVMIACPNKAFPVDLQHGPSTPEGRFFHKYTGLNLHRTFGRFHLTSYGEVKHLFLRNGGARGMKTLPLKGYFSFSSFSNKGSAAHRMAEKYTANFPAALRTTFLNPYVLVLIQK